jgi:hypothetical protein
MIQLEKDFFLINKNRKTPHGASVEEVADARSSTLGHSVPFRFVPHSRAGIRLARSRIGWPAQAQTVPKSLEEGGTDAAMKGERTTGRLGSRAVSCQAPT